MRTLILAGLTTVLVTAALPGNARAQYYGNPGYGYNVPAYGGYQYGGGGFGISGGRGYFNLQYGYQTYQPQYYGGYAPAPGFSRGYTNPTVQYHYSTPRVTTGFGYGGNFYPQTYVVPSYRSRSYQRSFNRNGNRRWR